ncbi:MAG: tetratricopeptide repeat protein [Persicimonas sp.]
MGLNRKKQLSSARKQVRKGNWKKALDKYQQLADDDPSDARSRLKVADLYARLGRDEKALDAYRGVARYYADDQIYEKAVAVYKQALRLAPDRPGLHRDLGDAYHRLGRLKDAVRSYHKAQKLFKEEGDRDAQRDLLERMIRLDPDDVGLRIQLAERCAKDDDVDRALELFETAADKLDEEGRIDEFIQVAERIVYLRDEAPDLRRRIIDIYLRRGENKHALKHLQICFKRAPQDMGVMERLIEAFKRLEHHDKAVLVMHELANLHRNRGSEQEAVRICREILELHPDDERARDYLSQVDHLDSAVITGEQDTGPLQQPDPTPGGAEEVDALDGVEFLDEDSVEELEVVPVEETSSASTAPTHAPSPEAHEQRSTGRDSHTGVPAGSGGAGEVTTETSQPREIEVIEEVEPAAEPRPDEVDRKVAKALKETDVFIKYGLHDRAYETIVEVIARYPDSLRARRQMKKLQLARDDEEAAADELLEMARIASERPEEAAEFLERALELTDEPARVAEAADQFGIPFEAPVDEATAQPEPQPDPSEDEEMVELDMNDVEFVDSESEPVEVEPGELAADFQRARDSFVEVSEVDLGMVEETDVDFEEVEPGGSEVSQVEIEAIEKTDAELEEVDELDFDESDFANAELVDMDVDVDVDVDGLDDLGGDQMVDVEDRDDEQGLDFDLTEDEADEMFDNLFDDIDPEAEQVSLDDDDPDGELAEVDFYLQQGLVDEASENLAKVRREHPSHPGIEKRQDQIDRARQGASSDDNPFGSKSLSKKFIPEADSHLSEASIAHGEEAGHNTAIELGTAYRDMGLYDEAIHEFEQALDDPAAAPAANFHIALCHIEQGKADEAASRLETVIDADKATERLREAAREKLEELGV